MALAKVSGNLLADNLQRSENLTFNGNLLVIDVGNNTVSAGNITFNGDRISANSALVLGSNADVSITGGTSGQALTTDGAGNLSWTTLTTSGNTVTLGTSTDGNLVENGAYDGWTSSTTVTDSIDDLNQIALNVANSTFVGQADFSGNILAGASPMTVAFTHSLVGNATNYLWDFGDGNTSTSANPSHTYSNVSGGQFNVTFTAYNTDGTYAGNVDAGAKGSVDSEAKTNYITLYTPNPIPAFSITDETINSASNIEITNSSQYATNYQLDWGDGAGNTDPGDSWTTLENTYTNSSGDTRYTITLYSISTTAGPSNVTVSTTDTVDVFSTHTTTFTSNVVTVVNEEATSGGVVEFENTTATNPGATATFGAGQKYRWTWGDGNVSNVNIQSGVDGNPGANITHTFALSGAQQSGGTTATFDVQLETLNGHTSSPFASGANITISVEPDVRAILSGTAVTVSSGSGDNQYTLYDDTDLDGNVRSVVRFTNTSQNADDYEYDYFNDLSDVANVIEDGSSAGTIGATLDKDFTGTGVGSFTTRFRAHGTPDTIEQDDEETITWTMKAVPAAPAGLSSKSFTLSTAPQGTSAKLCAGFDDNTSSFATLTPGDALNTNTVRRYSSAPTITTGTVVNAYDGASGTLTAAINASASGAKTFTSAENQVGTFTNLVVTSNIDYNTVVTTYPQRFYLVFSAYIVKSLASYPIGVNALRLEHSTTGNTNLVYPVIDDVTFTPTTTIGTVSENVAGTYQYISGIPYYDTGSPSLTVSGTTVENFTGQAYQDTSSPHEIDPGTVSEGSGSIISNLDYTYANVDGASSMLTGGIPNADTGVGTAYTLGDLTVPLTSSSMFSVSTIKARSKNANGTGVYSESPTKIQVFTATPSGLNKDQGGIIVSDDLGSTYDDDAVRISGLGSASDTPSFSDIDYYTNNAWNGAVTVAGTQEAIVRPTSTSLGTIQHNTTDYSTGYLPVGPDRSADTGTQYFTFAFRRTTVANFDINITSSTGITGMWIAAPGTAIDDASGSNGWLECTAQYAGAGIPGSNTGNGGNGSDGCALTGADVVPTGSSLSGGYTMTLGSENMSNATGNVVLVRIALASGESVTALSIGVAS